MPPDRRKRSKPSRSRVSSMIRVLIVRALASCIAAAAFNADAALPYIAEATRPGPQAWRQMAAESGPRVRQALRSVSWQAIPRRPWPRGEEGQALADEVGDRFIARLCRYWGRGTASFQRGDLSGAIAMLSRDSRGGGCRGRCVSRVSSPGRDGAHALSCSETRRRRRRLRRSRESRCQKGSVPSSRCGHYAPLAQAALAEGNLQAATEAAEAASQRLGEQPELAVADLTPVAELAFARGDLAEARQWVDASVSAPMTGWFLAKALATRAQIAIAPRRSRARRKRCSSRRSPRSARWSAFKSFLMRSRSSGNWR